ncbi:MAG: DUF1294 domain-containing protein [Lachnospiraceae bacterium]
MDVLVLIILYFIVLNLLSFAVMGFDKWKARKHLWRIPESTLFILAIIGGSPGAIVGMYTFHHKTKHANFVYGMPAILLFQLLVIVILYYSSINFIFM